MKNSLFLVVLLMVTSCASQYKIVNETSILASYESWVAGVRGGGSGINFHVVLKTALGEEIELKKVIFKGYEVPFQKQDNLHFMAMIKTPSNQQKFEGDDSQVYTSTKSTVELSVNEAILVFSKNGKEYQQKISNVTEKPALEYPSAKPKF